MILVATSSLLAIPFGRRCRFALAEPFAHAGLDPQGSSMAAEKNISLFAGRVGVNDKDLPSAPRAIPYLATFLF